MILLGSDGELTRPCGHPADTSVTSDQAHISISSQGTPGGSSGHSQLATRAHGDLSHTRPSWATHSLTEGDLILGEGGRSAVGTLVERSTRLVLLLHLENGRSADSVDTAMRKAIATLPDELRRSATWDQGAEMANQASFTIDTGIPIYFCDPHSPWQRGSNENTNGLLRQYLPKGTDLSEHSPAELLDIQRSLNDRPRKTLGYMTPSEFYAQTVALTG